MLFPIGDDQVKGGHFPLLSYSFIGLNILIFIFQLQFSGQLVCEYGAIPREILSRQDLVTLVTSMFLHGGWMHLIGNMLFLWVFADNIEATIGNFRFLLFYLIGGFAAVGTHIFFSMGEEMVYCCMPCGGDGLPCSGSTVACGLDTPMVGASGAISAVMGAYLVMFPRSRVKMWFFFFTFRIPAFIFLGFWIWQQWGNGLASLDAFNGSSSGVAWWAHIGGFIFGVLAGLYYRVAFKPGRVYNEYEGFS